MNKTPSFPTLTLTYQRILAFAFVWKMSLLFKSFFFFFKIYLFLAVLGLRGCVRAFSGCREWGYSSLQCTGFSLWWLLFLCSMGSRHLGFSNFGLWAQQLWLLGLVAPGHVGLSLSRDQTHVPCIGRQSFNHLTTREGPKSCCCCCF